MLVFRQGHVILNRPLPLFGLAFRSYVPLNHPAKAPYYYSNINHS